MKKLWLISIIVAMVFLFACSNDFARVAQLPTIDQNKFLQHVKILSSDEFGGRAPATPGGRKTVQYLEQQFKSMSLQPAFANSSYRQDVDLMIITATDSADLRVTSKKGEQMSLAYKQDMVTWTRKPVASAALQDSELVFVGYGVVAPEYNWNDYAGLDMRGKTAVIMVNDPGYLSDEDGFFKNKAMTYYGRWTYKFDEAARQGAAGAIIIHQTDAAGYPWGVVSGSWTGPQYHLREAGSNRLGDVEGWITEAAAKKLFSAAGQDFAALTTAARKPGFTAVNFDMTVNASLANTLAESASHNVAAIVPGTLAPEEYFIFTAHWDHIGTDESNTETDNIYNGAVDNATGTAAILELARMFAENRPQRSIIFLAVTAEESGLLGSAAYVEDPAAPLKQTVAGINMDGMGVYGATHDVTVIGWDASDLQDYLSRAASLQGRTLVPESTPEKGYFYRSDHFNFVKKGVPMMYAEAGIDVRNKGKDWGSVQQADYVKNRYHQPSDEYSDDWDLGGIIQDIQMNFVVAKEIANSSAWPEWRDGNEFKAIREASRAQ